MTHIIDENVFIVAENPLHVSGIDCHDACRDLLESVRLGRQKIGLDTEGGILYGKYQKQIQKTPLNGISRAFLVWLLTNEWNDNIVQRVEVADAELPDGFKTFDADDQIFLLVALNSPSKPSIIHNATDSDWLFFEQTAKKNYLETQQVTINQLCRDCLKDI